MKRAPNSIGSLAIAGFVAFAFGVAPVGLDYDFTPEIKSAFAKGKGSGKSGGKGGGSKSSSSSSSSSSNRGGGGGDVEAARSNGDDHKKDGDAETSFDGPHNNHGKLTSALGNLNAAHASPTALANASDSSIVGLLGAYAEAVAEDESDYDSLEDQQARLGELSNKTDGDPVDEDVAKEVNELLSDYSTTLP
jgi:hypothetical protein